MRKIHEWRTEWMVMKDEDPRLRDRVEGDLGEYLPRQ